jgi:hypothetical protein
MLKKKKPTQPDDELTARLRAAARRRRPWTVTGVCVTLALILVPAALCVWWFYPRPPLPPFEIVAFDQLGLPGAEVTVRACIQPIQPLEEPPDLTGLAVNFEEELLAHEQKKERKRVNALTGGAGTASAVWRAPMDKAAESYLARQIGDRHRPDKSDRAQIFARPAPTPLLLVDVQQTLAMADADDWRKRNILDISASPGAGKALAEARQQKYEIIYLATEPDRALIYRNVRRWVANQRSGRERFPPGPVLGRSSFEQEASQAREAILRALRQQFSGPIVAVVDASEAAAVSRAVGLETIVIGNAEAPVEVIRVASWAEVVPKLKRKQEAAP